MNWTTLYITGRVDFREEVRDRLSESKLNFMPGYIEGTSNNGVYDLIWIKEGTDVRKVKEAIGSKLIWKYRLRFSNLESFIENTHQESSEWTRQEKELLTAMRRSA